MAIHIGQLRTWVCSFAIFIVILTSIASPQVASEDRLEPEEEVTDAPSQSQRQDSQFMELAPSLRDISSAIRGLVTENDIVAATTRQSRESRALEVQEEMEQWARWMFYATAATVALTFAALLAIIRTLHHTGRAADYTRDMLVEARSTTKAALETIKVSREIGDRQTRPYLNYSGGAIEMLHVAGESSGSKLLYLDVSFQNCGQSPGILTAASSVIYAPRDGRWSRQRQSYRPVQAVIGANQIEKIGFQAISSDVSGNFSAFSIGILIWYNDLIDESYDDHVWLYFDGNEFRQDISYRFHGWELYRPDVCE